MNLGYFVRMLSVWQAVMKFHSIHSDSIQVVILGCGYDTLFWRLRDIDVNVSLWFDLDLPRVVKRKGPILANEIFGSLANYRLLECDLSQGDSVRQVLQANGFVEDAPTVFIDECSLIYVDPEPVDLIIAFAGSLKSSAFLSYGMIKPDDPFGKTMVQNFQGFGAPLKGIRKYPTTESHKERFEKGGYKFVKSVDMSVAMKVIVDRQDFMRVRRLEMQDDPDELAFMLSHYVLAIASTDSEFLTLLP
jgi:[phosphatase 2A protein]-leucine-carboxy methyltransferase